MFENFHGPQIWFLYYFMLLYCRKQHTSSRLSLYNCKFSPPCISVQLRYLLTVLHSLVSLVFSNIWSANRYGSACKHTSRPPVSHTCPRNCVTVTALDSKSVLLRVHQHERHFLLVVECRYICWICYKILHTYAVSKWLQRWLRVWNREIFWKGVHVIYCITKSTRRKFYTILPLKIWSAP